MASCDFDAVILIGFVFGGFVSGGVVAKAGRCVEFQCPQSAEPRAERHPETAVVVIFDAWIDGVDFRISGGEVSCRHFATAEYFRHVGFGYGVVSETGIDDWSDERPVSFDRVGGEQHAFQPGSM